MAHIQVNVGALMAANQPSSRGEWRYRGRPPPRLSRSPSSRHLLGEPNALSPAGSVVSREDSQYGFAPSVAGADEPHAVDQAEWAAADGEDDGGARHVWRRSYTARSAAEERAAFGLRPQSAAPAALSSVADAGPEVNAHRSEPGVSPGSTGCAPSHLRARPRTAQNWRDRGVTGSVAGDRPRTADPGARSSSFRWAGTPKSTPKSRPKSAAAGRRRSSKKTLDPEHAVPLKKLVGVNRPSTAASAGRPTARSRLSLGTARSRPNTASSSGRAFGKHGAHAAGLGMQMARARGVRETQTRRRSTLKRSESARQLAHSPDTRRASRLQRASVAGSARNLRAVGSSAAAPVPSSGGAADGASGQVPGLKVTDTPRRVLGAAADLVDPVRLEATKKLALPDRITYHAPPESVAETREPRRSAVNVPPLGFGSRVPRYTLSPEVTAPFWKSTDPDRPHPGHRSVFHLSSDSRKDVYASRERDEALTRSFEASKLGTKYQSPNNKAAAVERVSPGTTAKLQSTMSSLALEDMIGMQQNVRKAERHAAVFDLGESASIGSGLGYGASGESAVETDVGATQSASGGFMGSSILEDATYSNYFGVEARKNHFERYKAMRKALDQDNVGGTPVEISVLGPDPPEQRGEWPSFSEQAKQRESHLNLGGVDDEEDVDENSLERWKRTSLGVGTAALAKRAARRAKRVVKEVADAKEEDDVFSVSESDSGSEMGDADLCDEEYAKDFARSDRSPRRGYLHACIREGLLPEPTLVRRDESVKLSLAHFSIGDSRMASLADSLGMLPKLEVVDLSDCRLTDYAVAAAVKALAKQPKLTSLVLSQNTVGPLAATAIGDLIGESTTLMELKLARTGLGSHELDILRRGIGASRTLESIDLSNNRIDESAADSLGYILEDNFSLTSLDLSWNTLKHRGALAVGRALETNDTHVSNLDLSFTHLGDTGGAVIGAALGSNQYCEEINLANNFISGRGAIVLAEGIAANEVLKTVVLDANPIGATGARAMLRAISTDGRPRNITMANCNMSQVGDFKLFDPQKPAGVYTLDLADAYDRTVARSLLRAAGSVATVDLTNIKYLATGAKTPVSLYLSQKREHKKRSTALWDLLRRHLQEIADWEEKRWQDEQDALKGIVKEGGIRVDNLGLKAEEWGEVLGAHLTADGVQDHSGGGSVWEIPMEGVLSLSCTYEEVRPDKFTVRAKSKNKFLDGLRFVMQQKKLADQERLRLMALGTEDFFFMSNEAQQLLNTDLIKEQPLSVRVEQLTRLLFRLTDPRQAKDLIERNLDDEGQAMLIRKLGPALRIVFGLPTGHYKLDMAVASERQILARLMDVNSNEKLVLRGKNPQLDVSQFGTGDRFRNVRVDGLAFKLTPKTYKTISDDLVVELDFASTSRPPAFAVPITNKAFTRFLHAIGLSEVGERAAMEEDEASERPDTRKGTTYKDVIVNARKLLERYPNGRPRNPDLMPEIPDFPVEKEFVDRSEVPWVGPPEYHSAVSFVPNPFPLPPYENVVSCTTLKGDRQRRPLRAQQLSPLRTSSPPKGLEEPSRRLSAFEPDSSEVVGGGGEREGDDDREGGEEGALGGAGGPGDSHIDNDSAGFVGDDASGGGSPSAPADLASMAMTVGADSGVISSPDKAAATEEKREAMTEVADASTEYAYANDALKNVPLETFLDKEQFPELFRPDVLPPPARLSAETRRLADRVLVQLIWRASDKYFTCRQLERAIRMLPLSLTELRVDIVCVMFATLVDLRNFERVLWALSLPERTDIIHRLGILSVFNPMRVDGYFEMDLRFADHRHVASQLVKLAIIEPGENWEDESYENRPGWELPAPWATSLPEFGFLTLTYTTTSEGCVPVVEARREMKPKVLTWM